MTAVCRSRLSLVPRCEGTVVGQCASQIPLKRIALAAGGVRRPYLGLGDADAPSMPSTLTDYSVWTN